MRYLSRAIALRPQRGSVAVEAAITITFILIPLLSFMLLFGRYFWYYTAAQKTAHDAALYLAGAPLSEIRSYDADGLARVLMGNGLADIDAGTLNGTAPLSFCLYATAYPDVLTPRACNGGRPAAMKASITFTVRDPFLAPITGYEGLPITADATLPYVGH